MKPLLVFRVYGLDVCGHSWLECTINCPCVRRGKDDTEGNPVYRHDDDHCQCSFEVNDRSQRGTIEVPDDSDLTLLNALKVHHLADSLTLSDVTIEGDDGTFLMVDREADGRPLLQLEREGNDDDE